MKDVFFAASIDKDIFTIDLHNATSVVAALEQLETELFLCMYERTNSKYLPRRQAGEHMNYEPRHKYCRVVHGIGKGVLAKAVHDALQKNPLVVDWECDGGSCVVIF